MFGVLKTKQNDYNLITTLLLCSGFSASSTLGTFPRWPRLPRPPRGLRFIAEPKNISSVNEIKCSVTIPNKPCRNLVTRRNNRIISNTTQNELTTQWKTYTKNINYWKGLVQHTQHRAMSNWRYAGRQQYAEMEYQQRLSNSNISVYSHCELAQFDQEWLTQKPIEIISTTN